MTSVRIPWVMDISANPDSDRQSIQSNPMRSVTIQVWRPVSQLEFYLTATARSAPCVKDEHRSEVARQDSAAILGPLAAARSHPHGFLCLPPI